MRQPTAIDVFSGCGGLSEGLRLAGFKVLGAIDNDALAVETYKANHAGVVVWRRNLRRLTAKEILATLRLKPGDLDLLAGCPPCQGFSTLRTKNGKRSVRDDRNRLLDDFARLVRVLRPKAVMMENVPGLEGHNRFLAFRRLLRKLKYEVNSKVLNAMHYGVPQRRRRLILLASRFGHVEFAAPDPAHRTVLDAIGGLEHPRKSADPLHSLQEKRSMKVRKLIAQIPKNGGGREDLPKKRQLRCHREFEGYRDVYGRMHWNRVSPTITGGCCNPSKGRFLHPMHNRCISLREAALLQGFRHDYFFSLRRGKFPAAQMIGNALPPEFVRRHAAQILANLCAAKKVSR